jgi:hypothetical protein
MGDLRPVRTGATESALVVRDVLDGQLLTRDVHRLARVGDVELTLLEDGRTVELTAVAVGPEALARRVSRRFGSLLGRILRGRFDHSIDVDEIVEIGPWIRLRGESADYSIGSGDRWLADHLLRFIPGSGAGSESGGHGGTAA